MLDERQKRRAATASINNDGKRADLEVQTGKLLAAWDVSWHVASDKEPTINEER